MGSKYIQTIAGLILALAFLTASGCSDQSGSTENIGAVKQTQEVEESEVEEIEETETNPYLSLIEGEWIAVEYAGKITDRLPQEAYTEEYWEEVENGINVGIEETLGREFRIEPDNLIEIGTIRDYGTIIETDETLSSLTWFSHPEISIEAPYIGLRVVFQDDIDEYCNIIIDNKGIMLIEVGSLYFRVERKTETVLNESDGGEEDGILYFSGEEYFPIAEGEWIIGDYLCGRDVYGDLSEDRTARIIEEYSGQRLCIERDNLGYFGPAFGRIYYPEDRERLVCFNSGMEIQDLSPMVGGYIRVKVYLMDRDEWYYFIFDSTGRGIVQIQNRFFWLERE